MLNRKLAMETLAVGVMVAQAIHLVDELYRLYRVHKPKHPLGFTYSGQNKWLGR